MIKPSLGLIGVCATTAMAVLAASLLSAAGQAAPANQPITVIASDDTYVRPSLTYPAGQAGALVVGGSDAAVTYLKFSVDTLPTGSDTLRASLVLVPVRLAAVTVPTIVQLHTVADTSWSETSLTGANAPALGPVAAVAELSAAGVTTRFDVTMSVTRTGVFAFALTAPADAQQRLFVSKEGGGSAGAPQLQLSRLSGPPTPPTPPTAPTPPTPPTLPTPPTGHCTVGPKLVPSCGVMLGVAPAARTDRDPAAALVAFEATVGHGQNIFHSYHRGVGSMFPNAEEIAIARQPGHQRALFINWKPAVASWASIAAGNSTVDRYLDRLANYLKANFNQPFFFTVQHEPENDVRERAGSGYTAQDYAAMYRHVVLRLRNDGATNLVTVMDYMVYAPWNTKPWFNQLYPGDDVVDWIGWDMYGYSQPNAYGYGDFAEMMTRGSSASGWPGIYAWAADHFPTKPFMVAEWGVWYNSADMTHQAAVYASVAGEIHNYPQIKALVYFDTPNASGRSSMVTATPMALAAYRALSALSEFQVGFAP